MSTFINEDSFKTVPFEIISHSKNITNLEIDDKITAISTANKLIKRDSTIVCPTKTTRKGKWTFKEEAYAKKLVEYFISGYLSNVTAGTTLRSFLSEKLHWFVC